MGPMTILSMTGYGEGSAQGEGWRVFVRLKSLNHRHLDLHVRGLEEYGELELRARDLLSQSFQRGRLDVTVQIQREGEAALVFDLGAVRPYYLGLRALAKELGIEEPISLEHLLRLGALRPQLPDPEGLWPVLEAALREGVEAVLAMRRREGQGLRDELLRLLAALRDELSAVEARAAQLPKLYRERLLRQIEELAPDVEVEPGRLEGEVALWAERADITEELARLKIHLDAAEEAIDGPEPAGRRLDFLAQEMHREVNTIAAKARDPEIAPRVVEMRTLIERFREQVRNVE